MCVYACNNGNFRILHVCWSWLLHKCLLWKRNRTEHNLVVIQTNSAVPPMQMHWTDVNFFVPWLLSSAKEENVEASTHAESHNNTLLYLNPRRIKYTACIFTTLPNSVSHSQYRFPFLSCSFSLKKQKVWREMNVIALFYCFYTTTQGKSSWFFLFSAR